MTRQPSSDVSLKEVVLKFKAYISEIFRRWKLLCFLGFGLAILLLVLNLNIKPIYNAELSYMLNEDERGGVGGIAAMLGQFGLPGATESNFDKIVELSKTRKITQKALFRKSTIEDKEDFLANHLIASLENLELWNKKGLLSFLAKDDGLNLDKFRFSHDDAEQFSILENKALKAIHKAMVGKEKEGGLFNSEFSDLTGIMIFSMKSTEPDLSIDIVNSMYENLSSFYVEKAIEKQTYDYSIIKSKYDSISTELKSVQFKLARHLDSSMGVFREQDKLKEKKLKQDEMRLQLMYGEAEKQKQISELTLGNETPYIQPIDKPIKPLKPVNKSKFYYFLLGGLLGGLLGLAIIIFSKMYRDIMSEE